MTAATIKKDLPLPWVIVLTIVGFMLWVLAGAYVDTRRAASESQAMSQAASFCAYYGYQQTLQSRDGHWYCAGAAGAVRVDRVAGIAKAGGRQP